MPHKFWLLFRQMAEAISRYSNTYFVLVTATQPAIFDRHFELLPSKEKLFSRLSRYQVTVKAEPQDLLTFSHNLVQVLHSNRRRTLVVLNTIKAATLVFETIKEEARELGFEMFFLSSHIVPKERLRRIELIRQSSEPQVVVSTQLVEAGVDIDLDLVIRDIGPLDSINQVAGRANRNHKGAIAQVEVVCLKDTNGRTFSSYIYDPFLIDCTRKVMPAGIAIPESEFLGLCGEYFQEVKRRMSDDESRDILQSAQILDYDGVSRFQLIDEYDKVDIFVELDEDASALWRDFENLRALPDPWERRIAFLRLRSGFYQYVISVSARRAAENLPPEVAGMRLVGRDQIAEFYDDETGFIDKAGHSVW